jgi:hypothetical protein
MYFAYLFSASEGTITTPYPSGVGSRSDSGVITVTIHWRTANRRSAHCPLGCRRCFDLPGHFDSLREFKKIMMNSNYIAMNCR